MEIPDLKTGWKTSEFWLHLAAQFIGALLTTGILGSSIWAQLAGVAAMTLSGLGYTYQRMFLKTKTLEVAQKVNERVSTEKSAEVLALIENFAARMEAPPEGAGTAGPPSD